MGHSSGPCTTPQPEPKSKLELLVERFVRGTDEGCSSLDLPQPKEKSKLELIVEKFVRTSSNTDFQQLPPPGLTLEEKVALACASYRLSSLEEKEEVEGPINDNRVEQEELTSESSRGEDEQEGCIDDFHTLPESKFEVQVTSMEEQENPFYDLAWHLALQTLLEDMNGKVKEEGEEEKVSFEEEEDLDGSQREEQSEEKGREVKVEVEDASEVQDEDGVEVGEASTSCT
ncbi:unnamed protein product [Linum trigynum]|uniref:Uncharacterized protein n=1 Tax=Linum trigynum TaxID=586398 RepID=A0AAV2EAK3_9ROSI